MIRELGKGRHMAEEVALTQGPRCCGGIGDMPGFFLPTQELKHIPLQNPWDADGVPYPLLNY